MDDATVELIALWDALDDDARDKLLDIARRLAGEQSAKHATVPRE